jgi:hypothetical protein
VRGNSQPHREARLEARSREGQPLGPAPDVPKDARIGATRNSIAGAALEMRNSGETRRLSARLNGLMHDPSNL